MNSDYALQRHDTSSLCSSEDTSKHDAICYLVLFALLVIVQKTCRRYIIQLNWIYFPTPSSLFPIYIITILVYYRPISGSLIQFLFSELIPIDAENLDFNGCLVGPSGERVCPLGAFGADGQSRVQFRGNQVTAKK